MDSLVYEEESYALMQDRAHEAGFRFPYLHDAAHDLQEPGSSNLKIYPFLPITIRGYRASGCKNSNVQPGMFSIFFKNCCGKRVLK